MKSKKAVKRLTRVEALLSGVLDQFSAIEKHVRESLDSAKTAVGHARESLAAHAAAVRLKARKMKKAGPERSARVGSGKRGAKSAVVRKAAPSIAKRRAVKARSQTKRAAAADTPRSNRASTPAPVVAVTIPAP